MLTSSHIQQKKVIHFHSLPSYNEGGGGRDFTSYIKNVYFYIFFSHIRKTRTYFHSQSTNTQMGNWKKSSRKSKSYQRSVYHITYRVPIALHKYRYWRQIHNMPKTWNSLFIFTNYLLPPVSIRLRTEKDVTY